MNGPDRIRLFTAVRPDAAARAQLTALRDAWRWPPGARPVHDANLHATLHFIGAFPRDALVDLAKALAAVPVEPIRLHLAGSETFRGGSAVVLLDPTPPLVALHALIGEVLARFDVALEARPYRPHVTLARKAFGARPPQEGPALDWRAEGFVLMQSRGGSYEVLASVGKRP